MRKINIILLIAVLLSCNPGLLYAQQPGVAINTDGSAPDAKAMLDVKSTDKGILIPRMTTAQRTAINPATKGLLVFDNTTSSFWFHNGTAWTELAGGGGGGSHWLASGNNIYNANSGNVGVGTSTPSSKFNVSGNFLVEDGTVTIDDPFAALHFRTANVSKAYMQLRSSSYDFNLGTNALNTTGRLLLETQGIDRLAIEPGGNIGIGFGNPAYKLDVNGTMHSVGSFSTDNRVNAMGVVETRGGFSAIAGAGLYVTGTSLLEGNITANGTASIAGDVNSNTSMTITDPAGILQFKSNSSTDKGFVQLSGDNLRMGTNAANIVGNFIVRVNNNDRLNINPEGTVHLTGGVDAGLASNGYLMIGNPTASNIVFDNNEIMARNNGAVSSLVLQNDGGSVRIGNTAVPAGYKFAINGKMVCEELKVKLASSGWPDYVFDSKYKLPALPELEKFIHQNKHLPNIPSAAEVEKNGLEVGDMQKKMMEKIEELTLYVIELQKQIDDLKNKRK